jgi:hypothetical protein
MGVLVWLGGTAVAFLVARVLDFGRFHPLAELLVACCGGFTAGVAATWLDFGGISEPDPRAFAFAALVAFLSIGLARLTIAALRWPATRERQDESRSR